MAQVKRLQLHPVDNNGPNTVLQFLRTAAKSAQHIDVAAAFVTAQGLRPILYLLKRAASKGRVRVLTGLYQRFTEPAALRSLLNFQNASNGRLLVRISRDPRFHWKAYIVKTGFRVQAAIGSSNLTKDGLARTGEICLVATSAPDSIESRRLANCFERAWSNAVELDRARLRAYEEHRTKLGPPKQLPDLPLHEILGTTIKSRPSSPDTNGDHRIWRTWVNGELSKETVSLLENDVGWKNHLYFNGLPKAKKGQNVVLFDFVANRLLVVKIVDTVETPPTPDGQFFQAYRILWRKHYKWLRPGLFRTLKAAGLIKRKTLAYRTNAISSDAFLQYLRILNR